MLLSKTTTAQDTQITYDLTAETAVGTGSHTAYQLTTNRHHVLATRPNTAYLRGAVNVSHALGGDFTLKGAVDGMATLHGDHQAYLQQCFANLSWQSFYVEAGSREEDAVLRNNQLSVGSFVKGTNAKPVPQLHFGTSDFWAVPYTAGWLNIHFDFGYGKFLDSGYREELFMQAPNVNASYITDTYYHQKHLYLRSYLVGHHADMVAVDPVLAGAMLVVVAVA